MSKPATHRTERRVIKTALSHEAHHPSNVNDGTIFDQFPRIEGKKPDSRVVAQAARIR